MLGHLVHSARSCFNVLLECRAEERSCRSGAHFINRIGKVFLSKDTLSKFELLTISDEKEEWNRLTACWKTHKYCQQALMSVCSLFSGLEG